MKKRVCNISNLYKAMKGCRKGVKWKASVINYTHHGLLRVYILKKSILNNTYKPVEGPKFTIYEPKKRDITATRFRDRVPQRCLVDTYLYEEITSKFIDENCACLKHRGTDYARNILKRNLKELYAISGLSGYALKIDVKSFFGSIDHDVAKSIIKELINDSWAYQMICDEIDSHTCDVGIGLGSQLNQYIALSILNGIDHLCKDLGFNLYVRYMDDIIILHKSKEALTLLRDLIEDELIKLKLRLNKNKTIIAKITQPIHFLGFSYKLHNTGRVTMKVLPAKISKRRRRLKAEAKLVLNGVLTIKEFQNLYKGGRDHLKKGTRSQLYKMDKYYNKLMEDSGMNEIIELRKEVEELKDIVERQQAIIAKIVLYSGLDPDVVLSTEREVSNNE